MITVAPKRGVVSDSPGKGVRGRRRDVRDKSFSGTKLSPRYRHSSRTHMYARIPGAACKLSTGGARGLRGCGGFLKLYWIPES